MNIFNSLGSNYDLSFVISTLFANGKVSDKKQLEKLLGEKYSGDAVLVYKGREAIRLALREIDLNGSSVGICGFTCFAVYEAIVNEGYGVEYLDIEKNSLNFSSETYKKAIDNNPDIKVLIIQNTLGLPCDIDSISKICKERNIILIEDLAHSIGATYKNGKEAGTIGDFTVLSFSQDKMIDSVAGGALIVRNSNYKGHDVVKKTVKHGQQIKDRLYPLFTFLIRKMYFFGFGKVLHIFLKKVDMLSKPVDNTDSEYLKQLPSWYCKLIVWEFNNLKSNLSHRKKIAVIYSNIIDKKILAKNIANDIKCSSNLRFPIFVENRKGMIDYLKEHNIYVSDIWNDAPIAPKKYLAKTNYQSGSCPNSEYISGKILNLPTHKNVSEREAEFIADKINLWLKSQ